MSDILTQGVVNFFFTPFNISNAEYYIKKLILKLVLHYGVKLRIQTVLHC